MPIGSVVLLKEGEKRLMIFGVLQTAGDDGKSKGRLPKEEYDYNGVLYPEGNIGDDHLYLFDHKNIEKEFFRGYEDQERDEFLESLVEYQAKKEREEPKKKKRWFGRR